MEFRLWLIRGESGFFHVQLYARLDDTNVTNEDGKRNYFELATLAERHFPSVAAAVNHCAKIGIYSRLYPPVIFKYPLKDETI